jgi:intracellular septation protein A
MILLRALRPIALDFISTFAFLIIVAVFDDIQLAIASGLLVGLAAIAWDLWRGVKPGIMQWMSLGLVVVTGAASIITNDPRFVMVKPTLIYAAVGSAMLVPDWMLRYMPPIALQRIRPGTFRLWGYVWAALMFASAGLNLALAFALSPAAWALAMSIWGPVSKLLLFFVQYAMIRGEARRASLSKTAAVSDSISVAG